MPAQYNLILDFEKRVIELNNSYNDLRGNVRDKKSNKEYLTNFLKKSCLLLSDLAEHKILNASNINAAGKSALESFLQSTGFERFCEIEESVLKKYKIRPDVISELRVWRKQIDNFNGYCSITRAREMTEKLRNCVCGRYLELEQQFDWSDTFGNLRTIGYGGLLAMVNAYAVNHHAISEHHGSMSVGVGGGMIGEGARQALNNLKPLLKSFKKDPPENHWSPPGNSI